MKVPPRQPAQTPSVSMPAPPPVDDNFIAMAAAEVYAEAPQTEEADPWPKSPK